MYVTFFVAYDSHKGTKDLFLPLIFKVAIENLEMTTQPLKFLKRNIKFCIKSATNPYSKSHLLLEVNLCVRKFTWVII